jgi:hypothetical protein
MAEMELVWLVVKDPEQMDDETFIMHLVKRHGHGRLPADLQPGVMVALRAYHDHQHAHHNEDLKHDHEESE